MITKEQLKEMRLGAKMTQQELADKMGVTVKVVSKYETGARVAGLITLKRWSNACDRRMEIKFPKRV